MKLNGAVAETTSLAYANKPSAFEGNLNITKEGTYEVTVYSFDPATGNSGANKIIFTVTK